MEAEPPSFKALKGLGRQLTVRREKLGLTRQELADRVHCPHGSIVSIEYGLTPGSRHFWVLADRALGADGDLLADADRSLLIWAAATREHLRQKNGIRKRAETADPEQATASGRTFADRLGMIAMRARRHPDVLAAVQRYRPRTDSELAALTDAIRILLRRTDFAEAEIFADVWQTLLHDDPQQVALLSAAALVELSRARRQR